MIVDSSGSKFPSLSVDQLRTLDGIKAHMVANNGCPPMQIDLVRRLGWSAPTVSRRLAELRDLAGCGKMVVNGFDPPFPPNTSLPFARNSAAIFGQTAPRLGEKFGHESARDHFSATC